MCSLSVGFRHLRYLVLQGLEADHYASGVILVWRIEAGQRPALCFQRLADQVERTYFRNASVNIYFCGVARACDAVSKMGEGLVKSACRSWFQTDVSCLSRKRCGCERYVRSTAKDRRHLVAQNRPNEFC